MATDMKPSIMYVSTIGVDSRGGWSWVKECSGEGDVMKSLNTSMTMAQLFQLLKCKEPELTHWVTGPSGMGL